MSTIPYVVILAHPGHKSQHTEQKFGSAESLYVVKREIALKIAKYVRMSVTAWYGDFTSETFEKLYNGLEIPDALMQKSWIAKVFIDGKWFNMTPTFEEIKAAIVNHEGIANEEDDEEEDDEKDDDEEDEEDEEDDDEDDDEEEYEEEIDDVEEYKYKEGGSEDTPDEEFPGKIFRLEFDAWHKDIYQEEFDDDVYQVDVREIYRCVKSHNKEKEEQIECMYIMIDELTENIKEKIEAKNGTFVPDKIVRKVWPLVKRLVPQNEPNGRIKTFYQILADYEQSLFPENKYDFP